MPVGSRHRNALTEAWKSKPLGERTSFYSTSVPAEMEPRSRRLFPGSPAPLLPHSRTRRNTASTKALRHQQGWQEPAQRGGSCVVAPSQGTVQVLPKLEPDLSGHSTLICAGRNSLAPKIHSLSQQTEKKVKFVLRGKKNRGWLEVCTA